MSNVDRQTDRQTEGRSLHHDNSSSSLIGPDELMREATDRHTAENTPTLLVVNHIIDVCMQVAGQVCWPPQCLTDVCHHRSDVVGQRRSDSHRQTDYYYRPSSNQSSVSPSAAGHHERKPQATCRRATECPTVNSFPLRQKIADGNDLYRLGLVKVYRVRLPRTISDVC